MKLKYAYKGICRNLIFTLLIIIQLVFAFMCIYQNLDLTNKVSKDYNQFKKMFGSYKVYKLELVSSPQKFLHNTSIEDLRKCFGFLESSPQYNFCEISNLGLYIEKFKGDLKPFRETDYDMTENQKELFCAKNYIVDKNFINKFPVKLDLGRTFKNEEFDVNYGKYKPIPILVGSNYKKYFNVGDEITYHRERNVLSKAKIVGIIKENQVIPGELMSESKYINLNNYILTTDSVNISEMSMYFGKIIGNYVLFNNDFTKQQIDEFTKNLKNIFEQNGDIKIGLRSLNDDVNTEKELFKEQNKIALGTSIIIIMFVSITIVISLLNSIMNRKQEFIIHILNGATLKDISIIIYLEVFIIFMVSYIISIPFIFKFQYSQSKFLLIISFFIMILLSFLISFIPILKIRNLKIHQLIKGE
jgi:putative ABC transport system permease protein